MYSIFSNLQTISGVGDSLALVMKRVLGGNRVIDLLYHFPFRFQTKKFLPPLWEVQNKEIIIIKVKVESYQKPNKKGQPFRVICFAPSGYLTLVFFKIFPNYIEKNFPIGAEIAISGIVEKFNDGLQMAHPEYVFPANQIDKIPKIELIYHSNSTLSQKFWRTKIDSALKILDSQNQIPEWINENLLKKNNWQSWNKSILAMHHPQGEISAQARRRLAFDELLASQIAHIIAKKHLRKNQSQNAEIIASKVLQNQLIVTLPFQLTAGQKNVLKEIEQDLENGKKMLRLLQGDVGSGKTIVAFLTMLAAVENKRQAAIICPITLLAIQHHKNFLNLAEKIGIKIALLTSKTTKKNKEKILQNLANGEIDILIGTHSLIEPDIIFKDLAIIVIDEQHRFGVEQRMRLVKKGNNANVLLMSATPIPRSLMMTLFNDMEISVLKEKPKNRLVIDTRIFSLSKENEVLEAISRSIKNGEKIYWICPLIEESEAEDCDLNNVNVRYQQFQKLFGREKVALIHGQMKEKEKDQVMNEFISGDFQILVATTVIEVGIDVREATVIVIENCEKFGLSQLHQLRGRVGRGEKQSYCLLLYGKKLSHNGKRRLAIMKNSDDGFFIAEEDLKLRGSGELIGTKQSGLPEYKVANLEFDLDLLEIANHHAKFLLENEGQKIDKEAVLFLLKIFNYDQCFKLVFGG